MDLIPSRSIALAATLVLLCTACTGGRGASETSPSTTGRATFTDSTVTLPADLEPDGAATGPVADASDATVYLFGSGPAAKALFKVSGDAGPLGPSSNVGPAGLAPPSWGADIGSSDNPELHDRQVPKLMRVLGGRNQNVEITAEERDGKGSAGLSSTAVVAGSVTDCCDVLPALHTWRWGQDRASQSVNGVAPRSA